MDESTEKACRHYDERYDIVFQKMFERNEKEELGRGEPQHCRFCGKKPPEVSFKSVAHAIPECLGNRGLTSAYECDTCNGIFGRGIENDLGEWTKPMRTFARIRGKNGVPTLRKGPNGGWRIEMKDGRLNVKAYEDDPIFEVEESNRRVVFTLKRGTYTPIAVYKAFVKIGLTLMPTKEIAPFSDTLDLIRETDHARSWVGQAPIIHTFQNGPMANDRLAVIVLRRKPGVTNVPYAYLVIGYGNDVFQVTLPARQQDAAINGKPLQIVPVPTPGGPDPAIYGRAQPTLLDLTGRQPVSGETTKIAMRYNTGTVIEGQPVAGLSKDGEPA